MGGFGNSIVFEAFEQNLALIGHTTELKTMNPIPDAATVVDISDFWKLHDFLGTPTAQQQLVGTYEVKDDYTTAHRAMSEMLKKLHEARSIHEISHPERGWETIYGWVAMRGAQVLNMEGSHVGMNMRAGDVIIVQHCWDRDVPVTHSPIVEQIHGYLLSGQWPEMIGLFMPLFTKEQICSRVKLMMEKNTRDAMGWLETESREVRWPTR